MQPPEVFRKNDGAQRRQIWHRDKPSTYMSLKLWSRWSQVSSQGKKQVQCQVQIKIIFMHPSHPQFRTDFLQTANTRWVFATAGFNFKFQGFYIHSSAPIELYFSSFLIVFCLIFNLYFYFCVILPCILSVYRDLCRPTINPLRGTVYKYTELKLSGCV